MTESVTRSTGKQENLLNLDVTGPAAVPRKNGELVFETPWESRSFGIAVALSKNGVFDWDEFRTHLIGNIGKSEKEDFAKTHMWNYYAIWEDSLEQLLLEKGIVTKQEIEEGVTRVEASWSHEEGSHHHSH